MKTSESATFDFAETVAIAGVGLIGGSIALALKHRGFQGQVLGVGRNADRLQAAQSHGLIDGFAEQVQDIAADLWIFATPVDRIVQGVLDVRGETGRTTLITDAGSVKREICEGLRGKLTDGVEFIGSHPLAGSEQRGFEHADARLFTNRLCVLTPDKSTSKEQLTRLEAFWKFLGMRVVEMDAASHDKALAETSHLPHLVASVLASTLDEANAPLAATGFADTTRIASGDPDLWTAIFLQNADRVSEALAKFTNHLAAFRDALNQKDSNALHHLLQTAKAKRDGLKVRGEEREKGRGGEDPSENHN
jgi:prephenate dehydrogenase